MKDLTTYHVKDIKGNLFVVTHLVGPVKGHQINDVNNTLLLDPLVILDKDNQSYHVDLNTKSRYYLCTMDQIS